MPRPTLCLSSPDDSDLGFPPRKVIGREASHAEQSIVLGSNTKRYYITEIYSAYQSHFSHFMNISYQLWSLKKVNVI